MVVQDLVECDNDCAYGVLEKVVSGSHTRRRIAYLPGKRRAMLILDVSILLYYVVSSSVGTR